MSSAFVFLFAALALLAFVKIILPLLFRGQATPSHIRSKPILTENEQEFFQRLTRALPGLHIFPQVSASAILKVAPGVSRKTHYSTFGQFSQKCVDFVICSPDTLKIIALVELDDKTHNSAKDNKRDALFKEAGYHVIRFESKRKPSENQIATIFNNMHEVAMFPVAAETILADSPAIKANNRNETDTKW